MSEYIDMLVDTATALFADHCGPAVVDAGWSERLWEEIEKAELSRISVPESAGGAGGGLEETAALLRVAGRFAAPVPLAETLLAGWLLAAAGLPVPPGPLTAVVADGLLSSDGLPGDGPPPTLNGRVDRVPWARRSACLAVLSGVGVAMIDTGRVRMVAGSNLAGEPRDRIEFEDVDVDDVAEVHLDCALDLRLRAGLFGSALMTGAAGRAFDLTAQYVGERVQFGRPLNRFQAVQHQLADMAAEVVAMNVATDAAACALERRGEGASLEVGAARLRVGQAAGAVAAIAHQLHGAIGVTEEHVLRHSTTRLWSWREEGGNERFWGERVGREVIDAGAHRLWARLTVG